MAFKALQQEALETPVALSDQARVRPPSTLLHFGHGDRSCPLLSLRYPIPIAAIE
jgi:hypothetical protein